MFLLALHSIENPFTVAGAMAGGLNARQSETLQSLRSHGKIGDSVNSLSANREII